MKHYFRIYSLLLTLMLFTLAFFRCAPAKPQPVQTGSITPGEFLPAEWGKVYPLEYESWLKTKDPKPAGLTRYRPGWDTDRVTHDRLSEYPFLALLYNGWGFGNEYNEPRGHFYAIRDQIEVDPSRVSAGGVCLACKSPYHKSYVEKYGLDYLKKPYLDAVAMLPEPARELGPSCADCHKSADLGLTVNKTHLERALAAIGKENPSRQEQRTLVCAQCHVTYFVPRDQNRKTAGDITLPWAGSRWGNVSVENIIQDLLTDYKRVEWVQKTTGFGLPFIRHPDFEFFSRNSVHWNAGLACADCHMPYRRTGAHKISDHDVTSPLKAGLRACSPCHVESADWLTQQVFAIQDRDASLLLRAGYATAACAKLFELAHDRQAAGKILDQALYQKAKNAYLQAFLRMGFMSAENSTGFHNPTEGMRILGDAIAYAGKSEALLRQLLAQAGVTVPAEINLELEKYLNNRGKKPLNFKPEQEVKDPFGPPF